MEQTSFSDEKLPHNQEVEQALLSILFNEYSVLEKVSGVLQKEHFYLPVHGRIYQFFISSYKQGEILSPESLKGAFEWDSDLSHVGGGDYLLELKEAYLTAINLDHYLRHLNELYLRRQLIEQISSLSLFSNIDDIRNKSVQD